MPMNPGDGQLQTPRLGARAMMAGGGAPPQGMPPQGMPPQGAQPMGGMGMHRPAPGTGLQMGMAMAKQMADQLRKSDQISKCVDYSPSLKEG